MKWLIHYGIKGQRWGVRHGPPYPLDESVHKEVTNSGLFNRNEYYDMVVDKKERMLVELVNDKPLQRVSKPTEEVQKQNKEVISQLTKQYGRVSDRTPDTNVKEVNPHNGYNNCPACCLSLLMRANYGVDLVAKDSGPQKMSEICHGLFKNAKDCHVVGKNLKDVEQQMLKTFKDGDNGIVSVMASDFTAGHVFTWWIEDGNLVFRDGQLPGIKELSDLSPVMRTDDEKRSYFSARYIQNWFNVVQFNNQELQFDPRYMTTNFE